ncbi:MAG: DUF885 domain-containing protein [Chloroflexi bacterium]|nr:MAG: DUF885 domain-containing protein [Chloroflexota bacterium]
MTLPASDADARFERAIDRWFRDRLRLEPTLASFVGVHEHDDRLPGASREAIDERVDFWRAVLTEMDRFVADDLTPTHSLDRDLLVHEARLELHELTERRTWAGRSNAAEEIGDALFPLFTRDYAPLPDRLERIADRLEAAPRLLGETKSRLTDPVKLWVQIDLESGAALPSFLDVILAAARSERCPDPLVSRLEAAVTGTRQALEEHATWLRNEVLPQATTEWRAGPEQFEEIVRLRELTASGDEILAVGEQILAEERAARASTSTELDPTLSPEEIADLVKNDHPASFGEALEEYRHSMAAARRFVIDHDLATMPADDTLVVIETPSYLRHLIPFAAYYDPPRFDPRPTGTYIVTPPATPEMMREHSYASISNTSVHEAYPGHHLQLSAARTNPSLVRLILFSAAEFTEGWAFYCERTMKEQGFDDTPKHRYIQHTDAIWRATRIVLDVKLHRGEIGFEDAIEYLVAQTGFERPAALAEVKRYTSTPSYQLSYLFGRHLIDRLKADVERAQGPAFSMKAFHDTLIYGGSMPVSYARRLFAGLDS